jgi:NAD(P)H-quinone oxidoreductase subunit 4
MALLLLLLLPALAAVLVPLLPERQPLLRRVCLTALLPQLLVILLQLGRDPQELHQVWLPRIGLSLDLGLDVLSTPLAVLIILITLVTVLATPADQIRPRLFFSLLLATDLGLVGAVLARNALLFLLAFELVLIPTTLLLAVWGGANRARAAIQYLMYGAVSGFSLLGAVLALGWLHGDGSVSFAFADLASLQLSPLASRWILALLLLAFGLKLPVVPLHGWQPLAYSQIGRASCRERV